MSSWRITGINERDRVTFTTGLLWFGGVLVLLFGFAVGYAARSDDIRHYAESRRRYWEQQQPEPVEPVPQVVHAVAERVPTQAPVVVHVHLPGLPTAPMLWPPVVEGQLIRELDRG
jgi:hypothetical protein